MKETNSAIRPYERCQEYGPGVLSDAELLAVILQTGVPGMDATELAVQILNLGGEEKGILGLLHFSFQELLRVRGIGRVKAIKLLCIGELSKRICQARNIRGRRLNSPAEIAGYYMEELRHLTQEHLMLVILDNKNQLIKDLVISKGTVNASIATPREIFIEALHYDAVRIVLLHNHPSGDPEPSREDMMFTSRIREAGMVVGISLIDHIVIGDQTYVSMKERGFL